MAQSNGKAREIASITSLGQRSLLVGDGITDWEARETVTRFIGFAGLSPKELVKNHSDFYINTSSLYPIIPLGLSSKELQQISSEYHAYYEQGMAQDLRKTHQDRRILQFIDKIILSNLFFIWYTVCAVW